MTKMPYFLYDTITRTYTYINIRTTALDIHTHTHRHKHTHIHIDIHTYTYVQYNVCGKIRRCGERTVGTPSYVEDRKQFIPMAQFNG